MARHANWNRRHFEEVAEAIRAVRGKNTNLCCDDMAFTFARMFEEANPGFDRFRFLKACGVPVEDDDE